MSSYRRIFRIVATMVLLSFGIVTQTIARPLHAIHISFARLEWNGSKLTGKISLYRDDLDKALLAWSPASSNDARARSRYLCNYFRVWSNGMEHQLPLKIVAETDDGSSYIYEFEFAMPSGTHSVTIDNQILFRQFSDETNLMLVKRGDREYNYSFTPSSPTFVID